MTVNEVLAAVDSLRPNEIGKAEKLGWLMDIESRIYEDIYQTHEHDGIGFTDMGKIGTDDSTELFVKRPFSEIYILFYARLLISIMQNMRGTQMMRRFMKHCMMSFAGTGTQSISVYLKQR